jgi:t-SNARE complex subunit (syntaxin)
MDINELITKLTVMKKESPEEFKNYMNRLKIEKPTIYDKVKLVIKESNEGIDFGEEPLDIKIAASEEKSYTWMIILVIFVVILLFLGAIYFFSL